MGGNVTFKRPDGKECSGYGARSRSKHRKLLTSWARSTSMMRRLRTCAVQSNTSNRAAPLWQLLVFAYIRLTENLHFQETCNH